MNGEGGSSVLQVLLVGLALLGALVAAVFGRRASKAEHQAVVAQQDAAVAETRADLADARSEIKEAPDAVVADELGAAADRARLRAEARRGTGSGGSSGTGPSR